MTEKELIHSLMSALYQAADQLEQCQEFFNDDEELDEALEEVNEAIKDGEKYLYPPTTKQ